MLIHVVSFLNRLGLVSTDDRRCLYLEENEMSRSEKRVKK